MATPPSSPAAIGERFCRFGASPPTSGGALPTLSSDRKPSPTFLARPGCISQGVAGGCMSSVRLRNNIENLHQAQLVNKKEPIVELFLQAKLELLIKQLVQTFGVLLGISRLVKGKTSFHQGERNIDLEMALHPMDIGREMDTFFQQVSEIEGQIDKITTQLHKLQTANERSKAVTKASAMKEIKQHMKKDVDEVGKIALKVKTSLEELDRDNLTNRQKPGCGKGTGVDRSRMTMTWALKKKLKDRMSDFQTLRQNIQDEYREVVERRVFTVTGIRPDEETIEQLIETGDSEHIFEKAIQGQGRGQIMDTLAEIQERCDAVRDMEKKLVDLQQMFLDLSVLVEAQGGMIDDIEAQVTNATDHVQSATTTLQKVKKSQRNTRKYTCVAIIILLIVIIISVTSILKPWSKDA